MRTFNPLAWFSTIHVRFQHNYSTMTISKVRWKQFSRIHNWILPNSMFLLTLFLNHSHRLHNRHVHIYARGRGRHTSHLSRANAQKRSSATRQTHHSTDHPTNCQTNSTVSIKTLIADIKMFMNYTPSYKKTWLAKQRALEMIHGN